MNEPDSRPRGRPKRVIDADQVCRLASVGHTVEEIARLMDIPATTLRRRFPGGDDLKGARATDNPIAKGAARYRQRIRARLLQAADRGSPAVLIFLAKNVLGMSDSPAPAMPDDMPEQLPPKQG